MTLEPVIIRILCFTSLQKVTERSQNPRDEIGPEMAPQRQPIILGIVLGKGFFCTNDTFVSKL